MKNILNIIIILFAINCFAQNEKPQREAFRLQLAVDGEKYYGMDVKKTPYFVKEKVLQIYPSEKLNVEVELKNDTIYSMKVVEKNLNPEKTIEIGFEQQTEGKKPLRMTLVVKNPFDKILKYEAFMFIVGNNEWWETTINPVYPKLRSYEMWADKIITLILDNWKLED